MKKVIALVAARSRDGVIGHSDTLPWKLKSDLENFKKITLDKAVIMGRKTADCIGRPLKGRKNILLTKQNISREGFFVVHSWDDALKEAEDYSGNEICIIGGGEIYSLALPYAKKIYLTEVDTEVDDHYPDKAYFPFFDASEWREVSKVTFTKSEDNEHPYTFLVLEKIGDLL